MSTVSVCRSCSCNDGNDSVAAFTVSSLVFGKYSAFDARRKHLLLVVFPLLPVVYHRLLL